MDFATNDIAKIWTYFVGCDVIFPEVTSKPLIISWSHSTALEEFWPIVGPNRAVNAEMWTWLRCRIYSWGTEGVFEDRNIYTYYSECHGKCTERWPLKGKWGHHLMTRDMLLSGISLHTPPCILSMTLYPPGLTQPAPSCLTDVHYKKLSFSPLTPDFLKGRNFGLYL